MSNTDETGTPLGHVIDGTVPLVTASNFYEHKPSIVEGRLTALAPTVAVLESYSVAMAAVLDWHALAANSDAEVMVCRRPGDLSEAKSRGQLGIVLHFQGADPIEASLERLQDFADAGVRVMQPTYNDTNALGTGSLSLESSGLTPFGKSAVVAMGELGIIPDISHTSEQTARDTIDCADGVVIASHSNAKALYDHPRNLSDDVAKMVAATGGVVGVCSFPGFLGPASHTPTLDDVLDQAIYLAELVGEDHVSLGLDFADEDEDDYEYFGYDPKYYPPPPWTYPAGIRTFGDFPSFAQRALARGLGASFVQGLMGDNYARALSGVV